ncbi:hypothetical protein MTP99_009364 [Tenebrio molitor]|nr:hypothetical protein MTP99_009364 [Tenebrio molitor]CAH1367975.1 unnamed protein product [Tenebrio molitor]
MQNTDDAVNTESQDPLGPDKHDHHPILENEPTFSYSPRVAVHKPLKKIKRRGEAEFKLTASALNKIIEKAEDDEELFGRFIAGELRKFKNEIMKNRCKRELLRLLMEFQDNDDDSN